jgi:NAD(P)-dependent dehydrogenase (short-subunit alcohol dehydrogenase family)
VVITGRSQAAVDAAIQEITQELAGFGLPALDSGSSGSSSTRRQQLHQQQQQGSSDVPKLYGVVCDVTRADQVAALAAEAQVSRGGLCVSARRGGV